MTEKDFCGCPVVERREAPFLVLTESQATGIFKQAIAEHWFHWVISRPLAFTNERGVIPIALLIAGCAAIVAYAIGSGIWPRPCRDRHHDCARQIRHGFLRSEYALDARPSSRSKTKGEKP